MCAVCYFLHLTFLAGLCCVLPYARFKSLFADSNRRSIETTCCIKHLVAHYFEWPNKHKCIISRTQIAIKKTHLCHIICVHFDRKFQWNLMAFLSKKKKRRKMSSTEKTTDKKRKCKNNHCFSWIYEGKVMNYKSISLKPFDICVWRFLPLLLQLCCV